MFSAHVLVMFVLARLQTNIREVPMPYFKVYQLDYYYSATYF